MQRGAVCPADLCDIFECPEMAEKVLRLQVYKDRSDNNYEGNTDYYSSQKGFEDDY